MVLKFERDLDALEELPLHLAKDTRIIAYSADNNFVLTLYGIRANNQRDLVENISAEIFNGITLDIKRGEDGTMTLVNLIHGDDTYNLVPVDCTTIQREYHQLILTANDGVTVKYYEY